MLDRVAPYVVDNPWTAVAIAFAAGAVVALDLPGTRLLFKVARMFAWRELESKLLPVSA